jgi:hypothetical protein
MIAERATTSADDRTAASDDALFESLLDRLERAREEIEARFLAGGAALVEAQESVTEVLGATEAVVTALADDDARRATDVLTATMMRLRQRADGDGGVDRTAFEAVSQAGAAIPTLLAEMRGVLAYIGTCATATRITGAGRDEFRGFADDIAGYAGNAAAEVARFSTQVEQINDRLGQARAESERAIGLVHRDAPRVSEALVGATRVIDRRRNDLATAAERTADLVRSVRGRVATVLSALQIGDVTRQRIEHVRDGLRMVERAGLADADREVLRNAALALFAAQLTALNRDFAAQTRRIVETIDGLGRDAAGVVDLASAMFATERAEEDPMRVLEHGIEAAVSLASSIDDARHRAERAREETNRLAAELLDNAGSIGNLRAVRDDIRCLAINAYLKCSRLGDAGRAVGVIATEMSVSGERLGTVAEAVLQRLADLRRMTRDAAGDEGVSTDLAADLAGVLAALHRVNDASRDNVAIIASRGETVVGRIAAIARQLDFEAALGERLAECDRLLRDDRSALWTGEGRDSDLVRTFSEEMARHYTMAGEREIHAAVLGSAGAVEDPGRRAEPPPSASEDLDDFLL